MASRKSGSGRRSGRGRGENARPGDGARRGGARKAGADARKAASDAALIRLRKLCLAFPETSETASFGHPNFRAGKRTFATFERIGGRPTLAIRLGAETAAFLMQHRGAFPSPYGRGQWVSLPADEAVDWKLVERLLERAYRGVALRRMLTALDAARR